MRHFFAVDDEEERAEAAFAVDCDDEGKAVDLGRVDMFVFRAKSANREKIESQQSLLALSENGEGEKRV